MALMFALSAACAFLAQHSFVTYPASLKLLRRRSLQPAAGAPAETFAVCVCAYNEAPVIREKMENLLALRARTPGLEVLVYVDAASDGTADIVREYEDRFLVHVSPERHGKTYGMNLLVARAKASVLIFSDANVMLDADAAENLRPYFADPAVGCVCGHLRYVNDADGVTAANGSLYWRLEEKTKQLESDTGSVMGADGSIFAIRRAVHHAPPSDIIDDMYVSFSILCDGYRIVRADDVRAYEKTVGVAHEEFRRKVRIACQAFNVNRLLWLRLRQLDAVDFYKYLSHKLSRWFVLYFLVAAAIFCLIGMAQAGYGALGLLLAVAGLAGLWLGNLYAVGPIPQIADILYAFAGVAVGVWRSIRGDRFQTWSPAQSIRGNNGN